MVAVVGFLIGSSTLSLAQMSPEPEHSTVGVGAGLDGAVSPTGGFGISVPLDLPEPRGNLPVPVSVTYSGSPRAGAAGQGWEVPISYVRRSRTTWRRKPWAYQTSHTNNDPIGVERVTVALDGQPTQMRAVGTVWWPVRGSSFMELRETSVGWSLRTLDNLEYIFRPSSEVNARLSQLDPDLWLLTEIRDSVGGDKVVLEYDVPFDASCSAGLSLSRVSYAFDAAGVTPLYSVELDYGGYWRPIVDGSTGPTCGKHWDANGTPLNTPTRSSMSERTAPSTTEARC